MIAKINSPFNSPSSRAPRQEPTAQLAEGQDVVTNVVAGSSPGMCFSHAPHPLTLTVPDLLTDLTPLKTKVVHAEIRRLALEPLQAPHQICGRLTWFLRNWQKLTSDPWVLNVVSGYQIDWSAKPHQMPSMHMPNYSEIENKHLSQEVDEMMMKSVIEVAEPEKDQFVGHIFLRQKKS